MQRHSRKREYVYEALRRSYDHPSAEELYLRARMETDDVSMSSVYRNLSEFCNEGKAFIVGSVRGQLRYDANMEAHDHFICGVCGEIEDIERTRSAHEMLGEVKEQGMQADSFTVYGVCTRCVEQRRIAAK